MLHSFMEAQSIQATERYLKLLAWLHANRKKLMIGGGVAAVIALTAGIMAWQKSEAESNANAQLLSMPLAAFRGNRLAPAPAGPFLDLAKQYPDTSAGEYAALLGAESLFTEGKYPEAHQEFSKFIEQYPESALLAQARVGLAASLEGEGKISQAAQKYQEIISAYPGEANIVSPVKLTLARLDEAQNKPDQALTYYKDLARINNPYDPWAAEARERGELLLAKHPELQKPPPGATGRPPAASQPAGLDLFPFPQATNAPAPAAAKP
jgi:predicted negative regulator of RcsB-dependent stress response